MENPIRDQIRLEDRWQVLWTSDQSAKIFVPDSMADKEVVIQPGADQSWQSVAVEERALQQGSHDRAWSATGQVSPGRWHAVAVDGSLHGARLEAREPFHIASLDAAFRTDRCLSVRLRLKGSAEPEREETEGEAARLQSNGLLSIFFSLTAEDGRQIAGMEMTLGRKTRDLAVEMPLDASQRGTCRLKASLCKGETVIDNARIDVVIEG